MSHAVTVDNATAGHALVERHAKDASFDSPHRRYVRQMLVMVARGGSTNPCWGWCRRSGRWPWGVPDDGLSDEGQRRRQFLWRDHERRKAEGVEQAQRTLYTRKLLPSMHIGEHWITTRWRDWPPNCRRSASTSRCTRSQKQIMDDFFSPSARLSTTRLALHRVEAEAGNVHCRLAAKRTLWRMLWRRLHVDFAEASKKD